MATVYWFHNGEPFGIAVDPDAAVQVAVDDGVLTVEFSRGNTVPVTLILPYEAAMRVIDALFSAAFAGVVPGVLGTATERPSTVTGISAEETPS